MDLRQGTCPSCGHSFRVSPQITARRVRCPKCKEPVELSPAAAPEEAPAAPAAAGAKRRAGAAPARAGAGRAGAARQAEDGEPAPKHARPGSRRPPPKKSKLPLIFASVAALLLIGLIVVMKRDSHAEEAPPAAPPAVAKPDWSGLPDLAPAEGTSAEAMAQMAELMDQYIKPPFGKEAERAGDLILHRGKVAIPAILNAYKRIDLTTDDGASIGWKMQTLLLFGLTKVNFGWMRSTRADDVAANVAVIKRWFAAWEKAKLDDAAWEEIAKEAGPPPGQ
jgi:hypothetical protein